MPQSTPTSLLTELKVKLRELSYLASALGVLQWDQEVLMPQKGSVIRAETMAHIAGLLHDRFIHLNDDNLLDRLKDNEDDPSLSDQDRIIIREVWRQYEREKKLPPEFVKELAQTESIANMNWVVAKNNSDFKQYEPYLSKIITLKKQEAEFVGYTESPYDALLDSYEPYFTARDAESILHQVRDFLVPYLQKIKRSDVLLDPSIIEGNFALNKQVAFNTQVARMIGYDFDAGRLDASSHPFTINFHPEDVRITTRYDRRNILPALMATIHEAGHAMYEQGIPVEHFGTPLGESISLGIHESQSMIWENNVGRSLEFWKHLYPKLQKTFPKPYATLDLETFYKTLNRVEPGFIRVEADEVTYNLHIIIRFEIETALINGTLSVIDLPEAWNQKYKDYLGLEVPNDALGVLQDVHWSHGSIGYFPTYTLGKLYAAQFFATGKSKLSNLPYQLEHGEFAPFRDFLRQAIHRHGKSYSASQLIKEVTKNNLSADYFIQYIKGKYDSIYDL